MLGTEDLEGTARLQDDVAAETAQEPDQIAASLVECVSALREGRTPMCEVHENLLSFAMVEAAVASVERGQRVEIDELLEQARVEAIAAETDDRARDLMQSWSSVREVPPPRVNSPAGRHRPGKPIAGPPGPAQRRPVGAGPRAGAKQSARKSPSPHLLGAVRGFFTEVRPEGFEPPTF